MTEKYLKLVELQKETVGGTFTMGYSLRSQRHFVTFSAKRARFEARNPEECLTEAIEWVLSKRTDHNIDVKYTLMQNSI